MEDPSARTAPDWRQPSKTYPELASRHARPPDEEIFTNVWGAFGTTYHWWELGAMTNINRDTMDADDGWSMEVRLGVEGDGPVIEGVLNADVIWRAICQIAALEVRVGDHDCIDNCLRARNSMIDYGDGTIVFDTVAWDRVDFDQITSDQVMQVAVAGKVIW